jgi:hypothetical protein
VRAFAFIAGFINRGGDRRAVMALVRVWARAELGALERERNPAMVRSWAARGRARGVFGGDRGRALRSEVCR